jgi:ABC-2 type transport system permease protein
MTAISIAPDLTPAPARRRFDDLALAGWQVLYDQRSFWRNRTRAFFSFLLPVMFLVIFGALHHNDVLESRGGIPANDYVVPGLLAYAVIMATFTNIATDVAAMRDTGVLKRLRGTPLPGWAFVAGRVGSAVITAVAVAAVTLAIGYAAYGVPVHAGTLPGLVLALALGTACFSALGLGVLRIVRNAESAPVVVNVLILPLTFVSGVWGDFGQMPAWLGHLAAVFPIKHLAHWLQLVFDPRTTGHGVVAGDALALVAWTAVGVVLATRVLRTETRRA